MSQNFRHGSQNLQLQRQRQRQHLHNLTAFAVLSYQIFVEKKQNNECNVTKQNCPDQKATIHVCIRDLDKLNLAMVVWF